MTFIQELKRDLENLRLSHELQIYIIIFFFEETWL